LSAAIEQRQTKSGRAALTGSAGVIGEPLLLPARPITRLACYSPGDLSDAPGRRVLIEPKGRTRPGSGKFQTGCV